MNKSIWLQGMYLEGRDFGYDVVADNPDISKIELESEIYNYLMSLEIYRGYTTAVDTRSNMAAERVYKMLHSRNSE